MDYKHIEEFSDRIILKDVQSFDLKDTLECGQCFRWHKTEDDSYIGCAYGKVIEVKKQGNDIILYNTNKNDFDNIWVDYFDLNREYNILKEELSKDPILENAIKFGDGIRILQQEPFEILMSFIISANNRIPMIKRAVNNISMNWGETIEYKGQTYYTFPSVEKLYDLTIEDFEQCGVGFRAKYLANTVKRIIDEDTDLQKIKSLNDDECHEELKKFSGIGPKVADCIMLYSMQKYSAFPVDVWVKRAMQYFYVAPDVSLPKIRKFARDTYGNLSGFAQQYLFYYARENNIKL